MIIWGIFWDREILNIRNFKSLGLLHSLQVPASFPVALGPNRTAATVTGPIQVTCILCQEEQEISCSAKAMVLAAFVQRWVPFTWCSSCNGYSLKNNTFLTRFAQVIEIILFFKSLNNMGFEGKSRKTGPLWNHDLKKKKSAKLSTKKINYAQNVTFFTF